MGGSAYLHRAVTNGNGFVCPDQFRDIVASRDMWFVDHTAAMHALVKGRSNQHDLDRMAEGLHLAQHVWGI